MILNKHRRAVGVFPSRRDAEIALHELRDSGFPMNRVSVVVRDNNNDNIAGAEVSDRVGNKADEGATAGAVTGGALGGLTGLLVGLGALAIPGIGPVMLAGATATTIATTLSGGVIGAVSGGIIGALIGLGIPEERARVYNERVSRGQYLVIVDGTDDEIARAEAILRNRGIEEFDIYDIPDGYKDHHEATPVTSGVTHPTTGVSGHRKRRAIGIIPNRRDAEMALTELRDSGFSMENVSLIAKDANHNSHIAGTNVNDLHRGNKADEAAKAGAATGGILGGLGGLLVGLGSLAIPGVGPVVLAGTAATTLATTLAGGAIGAAAGGIGGALIGLGIPEEQARIYNDRVVRGGYLLIVDGTEEEIRRAEAILSRWGIEDWGIFDAHSGSANRSIDYTHRAAQVDPEVRSVDRQIVNDNLETGGISEHPKVIIVDHRHEVL